MSANRDDREGGPEDVQFSTGPGINDNPLGPTRWQGDTDGSDRSVWWSALLVVAAILAVVLIAILM